MAIYLFSPSSSARFLGAFSVCKSISTDDGYLLSSLWWQGGLSPFLSRRLDLWLGPLKRDDYRARLRYQGIRLNECNNGAWTCAREWPRIIQIWGDLPPYISPSSKWAEWLVRLNNLWVEDLKLWRFCGLSVDLPGKFARARDHRLKFMLYDCWNGL